MGFLQPSTRADLRALTGMVSINMPLMGEQFLQSVIPLKSLYQAPIAIIKQILMLLHIQMTGISLQKVTTYNLVVACSIILVTEVYILITTTTGLKEVILTILHIKAICSPSIQKATISDGLIMQNSMAIGD